MNEQDIEAAELLIIRYKRWLTLKKAELKILAYDATFRKACPFCRLYHTGKEVFSDCSTECPAYSCEYFAKAMTDFSDGKILIKEFKSLIRQRIKYWEDKLK